MPNTDLPCFDVTLWFKDDPEPYTNDVYAVDVHQALGLALAAARAGESNGRYWNTDLLKSKIVPAASTPLVKTS